MWTSYLLAAASLAVVAPVAGLVVGDLSSDLITSLGNNTLFDRWRPRSRFIAPSGWMNDPCGAVYDHHTDTYHLFYQWHPNHINWGNISWGHATSKDLVTWTDVGGWQGQQAQALGTGPVGTYDGLGVFSGTAQPVNINGDDDGTLLAFYTSVSKLPTSYKLPYQQGTESQSLASSQDGGQSWQPYDRNPILMSPPYGWNITGWRDPFFLPLPELDQLLGQSEPHYYAVFGSGIKGVGPRMPLYSAPARDLTKWTYLGPLWEPEAGSSLGNPDVTGNYGYNFEVSGFFSLPDSRGRPHFYAQMGTEGGNTTTHTSPHWALWNEGTVCRGEQSGAAVSFKPVAGGAGDWGNAYALTSFVDGKNGNRRVQWAWSPEDSKDGFGTRQQGFAGAFPLPRELFVHEKRGVVNADGQLTSGFATLEPGPADTFTATTLGIRPLEDVVQGIRGDCAAQDFGSRSYSSCATWSDRAGWHYELQATFSNLAHAPVGLTVAASPGGAEYTRILYDPRTFLLTVDRAHSSLVGQFGREPVLGFFYPYKTAAAAAGAAAAAEPLAMRVFQDGSLLEVYINDRFALTTRIYPSRLDSTAVGVYVAPGASATVADVRLYADARNVWPDRPLDSSSRLKFDSPDETNNYVWWAGN